MSYNGENSVDYTNTDPNYWSGVNEFFKNNSENDVGETGIWIPNLEKQGAESTALAASAGGVTAVGGSNYAGGSASGSSYTRADGTVVAGREYGDTGVLENTRAEYQDERPIKLASIYRGGTDGLRLRGTFPSVTGAATTDAGAAGMLGGTTGTSGGASGSGTRFHGGTLPSAPPGMDVDYAPWSDDYWKKNLPGQSDLQFYGGDTPNLVPGGWRPTVTPPRWGVQPGQTKPTYMAQSIYPLLSTPLGGGTSSGGDGTGLVKYAPPTGGGLIDVTKTTPTTAGIPIGATTTAPGREYDFPDTIFGKRWQDIPDFANKAALEMYGDLGTYGAKYPKAGTYGRVGGQIYEYIGGGDEGGAGWETSRSYPVKTTT